MATLSSVASALKSANAGATWITFDIVFADRATYDAVRATGVVSPDLFARLYGIDPTGLAEVEAWLARYRPFWKNALDRLEHHVTQPKE